MLGEDTKSVAEWTDLTLTSRNDVTAGSVPMVGFPYHKIESYMDKIRNIDKLYFYDVNDVRLNKYVEEITEEFYAWYIGSIYAITHNKL